MDKLINYKAKKSGVSNNHSENPTLPFCFLGHRERRDGLSPKKYPAGRQVPWYFICTAPKN